MSCSEELTERSMHIMRKIITAWLLALLVSGGLLLAGSVRVAHADGGAPQLAYVAGGDSGVSIIDIAQRKVTGSYKLGGSPQSVFLSLDGRFLYFALPTLNEVQVLAAKDGTKVCSAQVAGGPSFLTYDPQTG